MAYVILPLYAQDVNGNPYANAKLYLYEGGSNFTTLQAGFTDETGGTNAANPYSTNGQGVGAVWVDDGASYDILVKTADDATTIWSQRGHDPSVNPSLIITPQNQGDQNVRTTDNVAFAQVSVTGGLASDTTLDVTGDTTLAGELDLGGDLILSGLSASEDRVLKFDTLTGAVQTGPLVVDVEAVADINTEIAVVAGIDQEISGVYAIRTEVIAVDSNSANINAVSGNAANINQVAGDQTQINIVATDISGINTIGTVAGSLSDVTIVAADLSGDDYIGVVANDLGGDDYIGAVGVNIANVNTVATDLSGSNNIGTVATNIANVNTVAADISDVSTVATNMAAIQAAPQAATDAESSATISVAALGQIENTFLSGTYAGADADARGVAALVAHPTAAVGAIFIGTDQNVYRLTNVTTGSVAAGLLGPIDQATLNALSANINTLFGTVYENPSVAISLAAPASSSLLKGTTVDDITVNVSGTYTPTFNPYTLNLKRGSAGSYTNETANTTDGNDGTFAQTSAISIGTSLGITEASSSADRQINSQVIDTAVAATGRGGNTVAGNTITLSFYNFGYFGTSTSTNLNEAGIEALTAYNATGSSRTASYTVGGSDAYLYWAVPTSLGASGTAVIDGFEVAVDTVGTVSVTNSASFVENYTVYRVAQIQPANTSHTVNWS